MEIAIPVYDGFTALDAIGPYQVLGNVPGAQVSFVAERAGPVVSDDGVLTLLAERTLAESPHPEVIVMPGTPNVPELLANAALVGWTREAHAHSQWTTSVCTGALVLGAAGVLSGLEATTHWAAMDALESLGARPTQRRVVREGRVITAAGVSSGIDMALTLAALIAGDEVAQVIQLWIEYDPQPPYAAGSLDTAPAAIVALARGIAATRPAA